MPGSDKDWKKTFLTDIPLGERKNAPDPFQEEKLEFKSYATVIAQAAMDTEDSLTIGVFGRRGSGKTSLMRLAKALVDMKPERFITLWFNAWQYDHEKHLIIPLIVSLVKGLEEYEKTWGGKISKKLSDGIGALSTSLQSILYGFCVKGNLEAPSLPEPDSGLSSEELVNNCMEFTKDYILVRRLYLDAFDDLRKITRDDKLEKPRFVIFIDDLDRCHPEKALDFMKGVHLILNQPGFSFVIGICPQIFRFYIKTVQQKEYSTEEIPVEDYLDKMFPIPVHVPEQEAKPVEEYVKGLIQTAQVFPTTLPREQMDNILRVVCDACENNPRSIIRLINSLGVSVRACEIEGKTYDILGMLFSRILTRERYRSLLFALKQDLPLITPASANPVNLGKGIADILEQSQNNMEFLSQTLERLRNAADVQQDEGVKKAFQILIQNQSLCHLFYTESGIRWLRDPAYRASTGKAITSIQETSAPPGKKKGRKTPSIIEKEKLEVIHELATVQDSSEVPDIPEAAAGSAPPEIPLVSEPPVLPDTSSLTEPPVSEESGDKKETPKPVKRVKELEPMIYLISLTLFLERYKTLRVALDQDAMVISRDKQISKKLSKTIADTLEKSKEKMEDFSKTSRYFLEIAGMQPEGLAPKALRMMAAEQRLCQIFSSEKGLQWLRNPGFRILNLETPPLEQTVLREAGYHNWSDVLQKVERERVDPLELLLGLTLAQPHYQHLRMALYEGTGVFKGGENISHEFGIALADLLEQERKKTASPAQISQHLKDLAAEQPDDLARAALELSAEKSQLYDFFSLDHSLEWLRNLTRQTASQDTVTLKPGTDDEEISAIYWSEVRHKVTEQGIDPLTINAVLDEIKKNNIIPEFAKLFLRSLAPLRELQELTSLSLKGCLYVKDLEPLAALTELMKIDLTDCAAIISLEPLERLKNLEWLELTGCKGINELKPLSGLRGLKHLSLSGCGGAIDLEFLQSLMAMEWLDLTECRGVVDLRPLENMNRMEWLDLTRLTELTNLGPLARLRSLSRLYLNGCARLTDLGPLESAPALKGLYLKECANLANLKPLAKSGTLEIIDLTNCTLIRDLSPLVHIRSLGRIRIVGTGVDINGIPAPLREKIMD